MTHPTFGMVIQNDKVVSLDSVTITPDPTSICGQAAIKQATPAPEVPSTSSTEENI